jgi:hypothetical protein
MSSNQPSRFKYIGDWLISRSEAVIGGFQMGVCTNIIRTEGARDGWLYSLTDEDIRRILARYKEHVSFWNVRIDIIRSELQSFADAVGRSYYEIASMFDSLQPGRIPAELYFTYARIRKDKSFPLPNNPNISQWRPDNFLEEEISRIQMAMYSFGGQPSVSRTNIMTMIDIRGRFTKSELEEMLQNLQQNETMYQSQTIRYVIVLLT